MLEQFYKQIKAARPADRPVSSWKPEYSGVMDCRIKRDGSWWINGGLLENPRLQRLFSTVLIAEGEEYFLVTPMEKWRIQVDDLPFLVTGLEVADRGTAAQNVSVTTNVGDVVSISATNPVDSSPVSGLAGDQLIPFVRIRDRLAARMNRSTFIEFAELLEPATQEGHYLLNSANTSFCLKL